MRFKMRAVAVAAGLGLALAVAPGAALADDLASLTVTETPEVSVIAAQDATDGPETSVPAGEKDLPPAVVTEAQTDVSDAPEAPATETEIEMPVIEPGADEGVTSDDALPEQGLPDGDAPVESPVADEAEPTTDAPVTGETVTDDGLAVVVDEVAADETAAADAVTDADEAVTDDEATADDDSVSLNAPVLPAVGWTGNSYWDGVTNPDGTPRPYTGWVVDDHDGQGLQRYWVVNGEKLQSGLFDAGADGWGYVRDDYGWVLRGIYYAGDLIYIANNDGRLLDPGWTVTGEFTGGELQRYYVEADHAIHRGYSESGGYGHYVTDQGYVVRGKAQTDGDVVLANNDGVVESGGWLVTGAYDGGVMQRYYVDPETHTAKTGLFTVDGNNYYGLFGDGYVLRGKDVWDSTHVLLGNNDGVLLSTPGWVVTGEYDGGVLQRYWIDELDYWDGFFAALTGVFNVDGNNYYGESEQGYVRRNGHAWVIEHDHYTGEWCMANNDGVLTPDQSAYADTVNSYIKSIIAYAEDDSHGYDQVWRWGEKGDYDCSSLVITCLREAGLETGWATYTGDMRYSLTTYEFVWISDPSELVRGDILLNETYHTAIYLGDGMMAHASGNEFGTATGGQPGDQTGREICVRSYYDYPWDGVLRLKTYVA
ncbi:NlpC/P60 family protein [Thermophilibacter sp. ET337]|uniref:NlpC/P60 family protein n=1 Tax=Thermophilibacter sp. ET337 TaxID=2973084 RepID=UPI0021AC20C3|nr:NlpC/P60 family protein [Thermophilibacter sp. ET337]MCR8908542.1 NlpC/P60 family protein [Thermophilibacter sp. ET337]